MRRRLGLGERGQGMERTFAIHRRAVEDDGGPQRDVDSLPHRGDLHVLGIPGRHQAADHRDRDAEGRAEHQRLPRHDEGAEEGDLQLEVSNSEPGEERGHASREDADKDRLAKARDFVDSMKPIGGTAIDDALQNAIALRGTGDRPYVVIFLTDGQPTIGETKEDPIVDRVKRLGGNVRVFSFGIGTDVNTHLLDRIAGETKAFSQYVLPDEDIEVETETCSKNTGSEQSGVACFDNGAVDDRLRCRILVSQIDPTARGADRMRGDDHSLDQSVWIIFH